MILDLQIKTIRPEQGLQIQRPCLCRGVIVVDDGLGDLPGQTAGQADQPLRVLMQQRPVNPGLDIKALGKPGADQIAQVPVAGLVFAQQNQVGILAVSPYSLSLRFRGAT